MDCSGTKECPAQNGTAGRLLGQCQGDCLQLPAAAAVDTRSALKADLGHISLPVVEVLPFAAELRVRGIADKSILPPKCRSVDPLDLSLRV